MVLDDGAESALEACDWFVRGAVKAGGEIRACGARRSSQEDKEEIDKNNEENAKGGERLLKGWVGVGVGGCSRVGGLVLGFGL